MEVLWIDDDSPRSPETLEGMRVVSAQSIKEAEDLMNSGKIKPDWIVVDLVVPQSGWGERLFATPGIDYMRFLDRKWGGTVGIAAYGIALTDRRREAAKAAGAKKVFEKVNSSWTDVLQELRKLGVRHQGQV
jgi:hypothetical protein